MQAIAPEDPRIGKVLQERYRIVDRIGEGSMGVIYRGERLQLGRPVAIKFLQATAANLAEFTRCFEVEARALSRLAHPHCISIIDFGVADSPYLVMDLVAGGTLRKLLDRGPLPAARAIHITRQILAALAHAHGQGIIHRDVKPGNVMLTEATGTGDHVRILDFGLARLHNAALSLSGARNSPTVIGTPAYMSPEQATAEDDVDLRSDLYSAGILLYEMLVGHKLFDSDDLFATLKMQVEQPAPRLRSLEVTRHVSPELDEIVDRALQKDPAARFQSALEFSSALGGTPEAARPLHRSLALAPAERTEETSAVPALRDRRAAWVFLGGATLALVVLGGALLALRDRPAASGPRTLAAAPRVTAVSGAPPTAPAQPSASDERSPSPAPDPAAEQALVQELRELRGLLRERRDAEALARLRALERKHPHSPRVSHALGQLYARWRRWPDAIRAYRRAAGADPRYGTRRSVLRDAAQALAHRGSAAAAAQLLRSAGAAALPTLRETLRRSTDANARAAAARLIVQISATR